MSGDRRSDKTRWNKDASSCAVSPVRRRIVCVIGVDVRWRHSNCHNYAIKNFNGVAGNNFATRSCQRDIGNKIDCSVRAVCIKFQRRISREGAAADIEHTVCAKRAQFEHICVNAGIVECDPVQPSRRPSVSRPDPCRPTAVPRNPPRGRNQRASARAQRRRNQRRLRTTSQAGDASRH